MVCKRDGAAALSFLNHGKPDIIVTDLMMPDISGIEFIEQVLALAQFSRIPITAMTAYSGGPVTKAIETGANAIANKLSGIDKLVNS